MFPKFFTLEEARAALPAIKEFILAANSELEILAEDLIEANARFDRLERRLTTANILEVATGERGASGRQLSERSDLESLCTEDTKLEKHRLKSNSMHHYPHEEDAERFEESMHELAQMQNNYIIRLNYWIDKIAEQGVLLRDLRTGLLDFPAKQANLEYFLCWKLTDSDITTWHPTNEGFAGRKPLSVLIEYI